jgi:integral membrane protein (TIGR00529 family)
MGSLVTAVIGIAVVIFTVYLLKKEINLGLVMLIDSAFLVVLARIPALDALKYTFRGVASEDTIKLIIVLFLIMMLENIMRTSGIITRMVESLKEIVGSNRIAAVIMPAVIGLLPSPGGARFSCPMVGEVLGDNTNNTNKAFINYWYRHVWLDGFILYPGVILAAELAGASVIDFFLRVLPFIFVSAVTGAAFSLPFVKKEVIIRTKPFKENMKSFTLSILPVTFVIAIYIALLNVSSYSLQIASGIVIIALLIINKYDTEKILQTVKEAFPTKLVFIIVGVMVFKEILLGSGIMDNLPSLLSRYGIPVGVLFILLPFLGGVSSGITVSFVSLTFPILIPLGLSGNLWFAAIAFVAGHIGNMITPLHLCAVMSSDYFKTTVGSLLGKVAVAETVLAAVLTVTLYFIS